MATGSSGDGRKVCSNPRYPLSFPPALAPRSPLSLPPSFTSLLSSSLCKSAMTQTSGLTEPTHLTNSLDQLKSQKPWLTLGTMLAPVTWANTSHLSHLGNTSYAT